MSTFQKKIFVLLIIFVGFISLNLFVSKVFACQTDGDCSDGMVCDTGSGQCIYGTSQPSSGTPGTGQPSDGTPGTGQPSSGTPGTSQPGSGTPGTGQPSSGTVFTNPLNGVNNLCDFINIVLNIIAEIGAIVAVLFIIWSGFLFITAQGNRTKIEAAKKTFYTTIIGTAILLGASIITKVLVDTVGTISSSISGTSAGGICNVSSSSSSSGATNNLSGSSTNNPSNPGTGVQNNPGTNFANGSTCYSNSGCLSTSYCNQATNTCVPKTGTAATANGTTCYSNDGCTSGFCNLQTNTCAVPFVDGSTCYADSGCMSTSHCDLSTHTCVAGSASAGGDTVSGCTNIDANNYNPNATVDDGSCTYSN